MWLIFKNSFLSIVQDKNNSERLLVRARIKGDIENIFPEANVIVGAGSDYKYRAFINRKIVSNAIKENLDNITYTNFKNATAEKDKQRALRYAKIWSIMYRAQK